MSMPYAAMQYQQCHAGRVITCLELERGYVVSGSDAGEIIIWDLATGRRVRELRGHEGGVWCSQLSQDATTLVTGSTDRRCALSLSLLSS